MTSTVALRLVANGEAFIAETNRTMSALRTSITAIGKEMGSAFSDNLKAGTREAEAVAQASANRLKDVYRNASLNNGVLQIDTSGLKAQLVAAEQQLQIKQQLLAATERVTVAEGQATAVTQTHIRVQQAAVAEEQRNVAAIQGQIDVLERYQAQLGQTNVAQARTTAVSGQTRAGMQQLSFQVSDVAASFANGISPMVIFAQQSGQVIQAMSMMSTKATGFLAIMANPWFLAITSAVTILGTLAFSHDKAGEASDRQGKKEKSLTERILEQNAVLRENIRLQGEKLRGDVAASASDLGQQTGAVGKQTKEVERLTRELNLIRSERGTGSTPQENVEIEARITAARKRLTDATSRLNGELKTLNSGLENVRISEQRLIERDIAAQLNKSTAEVNRYEDALGVLRKQQASGKISNEDFAVKVRALEVEHQKNTKALEAETKAQRASNAEREKAAKLTKFLSPVDGPVTSGYGKRVHPVTGKSDFHGGIDYGVGVGTGVRAPAAGVVTEVGRKQHNGLFVKISHGAGTETMFLHLDKADVVEGQVLSAGEYFAKSGKSGRATGPHLDYRVLRNGSSVNPNSGPFPTDPSQFSALEAKHADDIEKSQERQIENHQRIIGQMQAQIDQNNTIMAVERLRAQGRDEEADVVAALAQLHAQYADVIKGTTENSAVELYLQRQRLAVLEKQTVEMARQKAANDNADFFGGVVEKAVEEGQKKIKQMQEDQAREQKRQFEDLATFWERAFSSGGKSIWADFKQMGRRVLSELAAQATISFLGNIGGGGSGGGISGLFSGIGQMFGLGGSGQQGGSAAGFANLGALSANMGPVAAAVALNQTVGKLFGSDQIKNGGLLTALFGPLGLAFGSAKKGSATLGFADGTLGLGSTRGNSRSRIEGASNGINSLADMLNQVADALGGSISGAGSVSLGIRKKTYVVDPTGQGRTKGAGVLKFKDEQAAIEAAFRDALSDGVIAGISAASQRILQAGGNIEKAIEKAAMIESIPKALKARLNPVGAALTELNDKWDKTIAALKEGGASAEQMADAEKLYRLEREEAMKAANDNLKEFIASLNYGPSSTYSLIDQQKAARADLETYLGKINSGDFAGVDQQRYLQLAQQYLDITREIDGSGTSWFSSVDELRNATQRLADGLSASTAEAARDPFAQINAANAESTAANTLATAEILAQQSGQLANIENYLAALASGEGVRGFIGAGRSFTEAA